VVALRIEELTDTWLSSLQALFEACSSPCFCRYWHFAGTKNEWLDRCANRPGENASELAGALHARDGTARGLVAVDPSGPGQGIVVGWMKLTERSVVTKLKALPVYRSLWSARPDLAEGLTTFSIGCVLVHPTARGRGVARALVGAAPAIARTWGARVLEAYPRRSSEPLHPEEVWQGPERLFIEAGFEAVHDVPPYPVYQKRLGEPNREN
jgi:GNAT superfamily N-acetyltransferase